MAINCSCSDVTGYRTLLELRQDMMRRLGYGAQIASPPPGVADLLTSFLQDAQRTLIRRYPSLRTERWFSWSLVAGERFYDLPDNDELGLSPPTGLTRTAPDSNLPGDNLTAGVYSYKVTAINAIGETLPSAAVVTVPGAWHAMILSWDAVPRATGYRLYRGDSGSELLIATTTATTYRDQDDGSPAGALPVANTTIECDKQIDPLRITWAGVQRDTVWQPMRRGIPPVVLGRTVTNSWPTHYDVRQCLEIWPAPAATEGTLRIRAHFRAEPFAADSDKPTIDDQAVFLLALANAKAHYGKPDANNIVSQLEVYLQSLVAGTHGPQRYVPGAARDADMVYVEPKASVPF